MRSTRKNIPRVLVFAVALAACNKGVGQVENTETGAEGESESAGETETTAAPESESTNFVPGDVGGATPAACDPFMQDCPGGEKCVPYVSGGDTWDANKCVPVTGDGQAGDICKSSGAILGTDDCGAGSLCWDTMEVQGEQVGVCTPFCMGSAETPVCDPGHSCMITNDGSINLCIPTCDPLLQDCGDGLGCFWAANSFNCVFATDNIATGQVCGYINDCAPGNFCADASALPACEGAACCAAFCDVSAPTCEVAGTECTSFFEEGQAPPGYENVGLCVLPT